MPYPSSIGTNESYRDHLMNPETMSPYGPVYMQIYPNLGGVLLSAGIGADGKAWSWVMNEQTGEVYFFEDGFANHAEALAACVRWVANTPEMIGILMSNMQVDG